MGVPQTQEYFKDDYYWILQPQTEIFLQRIILTVCFKAQSYNYNHTVTFSQYQNFCTYPVDYLFINLIGTITPPKLFLITQLIISVSI